MRTRRTKWLKIAIPGCFLLQITACLGSDPQFFFASSFTNALVYNIVTATFDSVRALFGSVVGGV